MLIAHHTPSVPKNAQATYLNNYPNLVTRQCLVATLVEMFRFAANATSFDALHRLSYTQLLGPCSIPLSSLESHSNKNAFIGHAGRLPPYRATMVCRLRTVHRQNEDLRRRRYQRRPDLELASRCHVLHPNSLARPRLTLAYRRRLGPKCQRLGQSNRIARKSAA